MQDNLLSQSEIESINRFCEKLEKEQIIEVARSNGDFSDVWSCEFTDIEFADRIWEIQIRIVNFNSSSNRLAPYHVSAKTWSDSFETVMGQKHYFNDLTLNPSCKSLTSAKQVAKRYFYYISDRFNWKHHIEWVNK